jgi:hypothetical protein
MEEPEALPTDEALPAAAKKEAKAKDDKEEEGNKLSKPKQF